MHGHDVARAEYERCYVEALTPFLIHRVVTNAVKNATIPQIVTTARALANQLVCLYSLARDDRLHAENFEEAVPIKNMYPLYTLVPFNLQWQLGTTKDVE